MLMEDDVVWKQAVTKQLEMLRYAVGSLADKLHMPELQLATQEGFNLDQLLVNSTQKKSSENSNHSHSTQVSDHAWAVDPQCEPSSMPASVIVEIRDAAPEVTNSTKTPTLVSKGIVTIEEAQALFTIYRERLNHLLYQIVADEVTLEAVLDSSPLLAAAICTVAALHSAHIGHLFEACLAELQHLVSSKSLLGKHNMDDVRGLCIGGFWLNSLSWALSGSVVTGIAVRISVEIGLHSAIQCALDGDADAYMRTRLYYLVYVCDHHNSVIYGRPPLTRESTSTRAAMKLLETENATEDDVRLVTQVKLWSIYGEISDCFGTETRNPLSSTQLIQLRRFGIKLDTWYADWKDRFGPNERVGNYPAKGVGLHFYFAKLYLCSHAFRGLEGVSSQTLLPDQEEVANSAIFSATSILNILISDVEMQKYLNGLPLCFDMMITFAIVFLVKVATKYHGSVWVDKARIFDMVKRMVSILHEVTERMHAKHLLAAATLGLKNFAQKAREGRFGGEIGVDATRPSSPDLSSGRESEMDWLQNYDIFENFDFQTLVSDPSCWATDL
ncbi:Transcription factor [Akanthomyces lecanii RCEF 1005]|uniref:Transcription factor n=1 Tax=Akanthomyces lecanii RCEF 1005 TaxID=1081108 RepID=A0A162N4W8_CORDF|nr:Transcription factor [Akanthomyces lecanii RCEF 1005]